MITEIRNETPSAEELKAYSDKFERSSPEDILEWAVEKYYPHLTMATAFGAEGCVLMAMLAQIAPNGKNVSIFNLDTGYQFKETLETRERIHEHYGIKVEYVEAAESVASMEQRFGGPIYYSNPDECCRIRKVVPLRQRVTGSKAWISAIRRDQTAARANAGIVEWDKKFGLVKINPLANWTKRDIWAYITINEVPYNPLHDQGYPSIGCWPCTHKVAEGDDDRAGRWKDIAKLECGLHTPEYEI